MISDDPGPIKPGFKPRPDLTADEAERVRAAVDWVFIGAIFAGIWLALTGIVPAVGAMSLSIAGAGGFFAFEATTYWLSTRWSR